MAGASQRDLEFIIRFKNEAKAALSQATGQINSLGKAAAAQAKGTTSSINAESTARTRNNQVLKQTISLQRELAKEAAAATKHTTSQTKGIINALNQQGAAQNRASSGIGSMSKHTAKLTEEQKKLIDRFHGTAQGMSVMLGPLSGVTSRFTSLLSLIKSNGVGLAALTVGIAAAAFGFIKLVQAGDAYIGWTNKIRIALDGSGGVNESFERLLKLSNDTRSPLSANIALFQKASGAAAELGASNDQIYEFVENVGRAVSIGGSSAEAASGALLQLGQALSTGVVHAEEYNSILEGAYPVAQAAARGILGVGGTVGQLTVLVKKGKISSDEFFKAILSQSDELKRKFGLSVASVSQAFKLFIENLTVVAGKISTGLGINDFISNVLTGLTSALQFLSENILEVKAAIVGLAAASAAYFVVGGGLVKVLRLIGTAALFAAERLWVMTAALLANPWGLFAVAVGVAAAAIYKYTAVNEEAIDAIRNGKQALADYKKEHNETAQEALASNQKIRAAWETVKDVVGLAAEAIGSFMEDIGYSISDVFGRLVRDAPEWVRKVFTILKTGFDQFRKVPIQAMADMVALITTGFVTVGNIVYLTFNAMIDKAKQFGANLKAALKGDFSKLTEEIPAIDFEKIFSQAQPSAAKIGKSLGEAIVTGADVVQAGLAKAYDKNVQPIYEENLKLIKETDDKLLKQESSVRKITQAAKELTKEEKEALKQAEKRKEIYDEAVRSLENEIALLRIPIELREDENFLLQVRNQLIKEGGDLTRTQEIELRKLLAIRKELKEADEDYQEQIQKNTEALKDFANTFREDFSSVIQGFFDNGIKGFSSMLDSWKARFKKMLADMIAASIANPIIISVATSIGGGFGLSSKDALKAAGVDGSGGGMSLASMGSSVMNLLSGGTSSTLVGAFDAVGEAFGIGSRLALPGGEAGATLLGGLSESSTLTNGSFGGSLGGAAGGFIGNLGANAIFGNRGMGADIGGMIGGIAGSFIPVPILGPMIGSFIGNAIGGLFGGKKPSSKAQAGYASFGTGLISDRDGLTGKKFSQENYDMVTNLGVLVGTLTKALDIKSGGTSVVVSAREGFGFQNTDNPSDIFTAGKDTRTSFPTVNEFVGGFLKDLETRFPEKFDETLKTALTHIDFGTTQEALEAALADVAFAVNFDDLGVIKPVNELKERILALNTQFDEAAKTAERLGLSVDKVRSVQKDQIELMRDEVLVAIGLKDATHPLTTALEDVHKYFDMIREVAGDLGIALEDVAKAEEARVRGLRGDFLRGVDAAIREITDPVANKIIAQVADYQAMLKEAQALGLGTASVEQLHRLRMLQLAKELNYFGDSQASQQAAAIERQKELVDQLRKTQEEAQALAGTFAGLAESLRDTLNDIQLGDLSPMPLKDRLAFARANFETIKAQSENGDAAARAQAIEQLPEAARTLLELSREFNASNGAYDTDFENIVAVLEEARQYAATQADIQLQIANNGLLQIQAAEKQLEELKNVAAGIGTLDTSMNALAKQLLDSFFKDSQTPLTGVTDPYTKTGFNAAGVGLQEIVNGATVGQIEASARSILASAGINYNGPTGSGQLTALLQQNGLEQKQWSNIQSIRGYASGTSGSPIGQMFATGENGMELMHDKRSFQVISHGETVNLATNSLVVEALNGIYALQTRILNALDRVANNTADVASRDSGIQQLREIATNTRNSQSYWGAG